MTSHDVVAKVRKLVGTRKVGHAGTLDPMATGLLILGIESATKLLTFVVGLPKTYLATIRLGSSTVTDDKEGDTVFTAEEAKLSAVTDKEIQEEVLALTGVIQQVPSSVSAIKVAGERAYAKVRAGESVALKSREVTVSKFEITSPFRRSSGFIDFEVLIDCSSGTYIRALARDLGEKLGVGGHLTQLRRSHIGDFNVEGSLNLGSSDATNISIIKSLDSAAKVMPAFEISKEQALAIRQGKRINLSVLGVSAVSFAGELVAVVEPVGQEFVKSLVVFMDGELDG